MKICPLCSVLYLILTITPSLNKKTKGHQFKSRWYIQMADCYSVEETIVIIKQTSNILGFTVHDSICLFTYIISYDISPLILSVLSMIFYVS